MSEPPHAKASTFEDRTLEELARTSDRVVIGQVIETVAMPAGPSGQPGIHTRATIAVRETLRGSPRSSIEVWVQGGELGNRIRWVSGQAQFAPSEDVLLFLFESNGVFWPNGMARGKWTQSGTGWAPSIPLVDASSHPDRIEAVDEPRLRTAIRGAR